MNDCTIELWQPLSRDALVLPLLCEIQPNVPYVSCWTTCLRDWVAHDRSSISMRVASFYCALDAAQVFKPRQTRGVESTRAWFCVGCIEQELPVARMCEHLETDQNETFIAGDGIRIRSLSA